MLIFSSQVRLCKRIAVAILLCAGIPAAFADVTLPRLLSDGAILQRDKPVTIWGWADEGESVNVEFAGKALSTTAQDGRWSLTFPALKAGGPHNIKVTGKNELQVKDVLMGDLWIGAGQSNMELPLRRVATRYPDVISQTQLPQVREFSVPVTYTFKEKAEDYTQGQWKTATPDNLANFSAVGFFFAQEIHAQEGVPVGILSISVGGSPAEAWMSEAALEKYPHYLETANKFKDDAVLQQTIAQDKANSDAWYAKASKDDIGLAQNQLWSAPSQSTHDWKQVKVPGFLHEQGIDFDNGVIWFKKSVDLTEAQASQEARLWLGAIVDGDEAFINGVAVGQTGYRYPPRIYSVPKNILKTGKNDITLRVTSYSGDAGFVKDKLYALEVGNTKIDLEGEWKYKIGMRAAAMSPSTTIHYLPTSLFKAKLAPAFPLNIKGVIWAQGESNVSRAEEYKTLFPDLITDWRAQFNQGNFPFIFVQLANFLEPKAEPGESEWAMAREAQRQALSLPNTAMAVAIDIGEWNDIHPLNKQDVGKRLALAAEKIAYGKKSILASGPDVKSVNRKGKQLIITFDHVGKGLEARGDETGDGAQGTLREFAIAGADKKFVWAKATIKGKRVSVSSESVTDPVWVRYAWADNPEHANLYNSAGLPASPFEARVTK